MQSRQFFQARPHFCRKVRSYQNALWCLNSPKPVRSILSFMAGTHTLSRSHRVAQSIVMFHSKVIVVTGSSSGIGARTAVRFSKEHAAAVVLSGRRSELLEKVKQECESASGGRCKVKVVVGDVTNEQVQKQLINDTVKEFGRLDVLVNNAGITTDFSLMAECPIETFDDVFNINVHSIIQLTQLAVPHLINSKGNIVNVSSIMAVIAGSTCAYYCMSKAALDHYSRCLAVELGPQGVRVNSMAPGFVPDTDICRNIEKGETFAAVTKSLVERMPLRRAGTSEEIANTIVFLASEQASFITGSVTTADGGGVLG